MPNLLNILVIREIYENVPLVLGTHLAQPPPQ